MAHYKGAAAEATRAMHIMKRREREREEIEQKKRKLTEDVKVSTIDNKFATHHDSIEAQLRTSTVGLVTLDEMRERQVNAIKEHERQIATKEAERLPSKMLETKRESHDKSKGSKSLSFGYDDEEDDGDSDEDSSESSRDQRPKETTSIEEVKSEADLEKRFESIGKKNQPSIASLNVETDFLPDREREEEERRLREKLAEEWRERQQRLKEEEIEITFSYWDGSGHRRVVTMKKGNSIYQFLQACLETLRKDFQELRKVSADRLMYVKEDLIIPHHYTFYDFIVTKARGKSGPLFSFDVHDDVRLIADARVEKDESHAGKVLLRSWYERNKHIFPASRWEPYDPARTYEKYTISDKKSK